MHMCVFLYLCMATCVDVCACLQMCTLGLMWIYVQELSETRRRYKARLEKHHQPSVLQKKHDTLLSDRDHLISSLKDLLGEYEKTIHQLQHGQCFLFFFVIFFFLLLFVFLFCSFSWYSFLILYCICFVWFFFCCCFWEGGGGGVLCLYLLSVVFFFSLFMFFMYFPPKTFFDWGRGSAFVHFCNACM